MRSRPVIPSMWRIAVVALATTACAAPASADPRIAVTSGFGPGHRCAFADQGILVAGRGFAPGRMVRVGSERARAGRRGRFTAFVAVPAPHRAQRRVTVRARQGRTSAVAHYWAVVEGIHVPGWDDGRRAQPGKRERARFGGFAFAAGRPLFVHYLFKGRQVFAQRVARLRGPCGAADFRLTQFPFAAEGGPYRIDFGLRRTVDPQVGGGYRRVLVTPAPPPAPLTPLFTVAGDGTVSQDPDGGPATASGLYAGTSVAPLPDGGFLLPDDGRVRVVDPSGLVRTVAGTGRWGFSGDGGPAIAARVDPGAVAVLPSGGFIFAQCDPAPPAVFGAGRVRRVDASGTISTIAGAGVVGDVPDGTPARSAEFSCLSDVAVAADGRVLIADRYRVYALGPDNIVRVLAGTGEFPEEHRGGPARRTAVEVVDLAPLPDGSVLIADDISCRVYRLAGDRLAAVAGSGHEGRRDDDGARALDANVCPRAVAPVAGGGFYVADNGRSSAAGSEPRLRFVDAGGRITTVAGTGRFAPEPSGVGELRGDGAPAALAGLRHLTDVAVLPDGGVIFTEGNYEGRRPVGLVRYLPPTAGARLAVGVRRDRDRIFARSGPAYTTVSLTAPAEVTLTVRRGSATLATITRTLPAGDTRIELPVLRPVPHRVAVTARDDRGRVAEDRAAILPRGWLSDELARAVATELIYVAAAVQGYSGSGLGRCRRFAAGRVDCEIVPETRCVTVVTIRLGTDSRLRWGTHRCSPGRSQQRRIKRLRPLHKHDIGCEIFSSSCPAPLTGRLADRWLVPWD